MESRADLTPYLDVHTHLHDQRIIGDISGIITRAKAAGLGGMVTCATMEENFSATAELAKTYGSVLPCFGIHPWFLDTLTRNWVENLASWLEKTPSGIGETGLDFMIGGADRELQIRVFTTHLELANDLNRPMNIHIRKAWDPFIYILKKNGPLKAGGLIHSFSGSADLVKVLEKFNLHISFSGAVTRPNAKKIVRALNAVSLERILFETDSPDIYPSFEDTQNFGKQLNQPANLPEIVKIAARRRKIEFDQLAGHGYNNGLNLFSPII